MELVQTLSKCLEKSPLNFGEEKSGGNWTLFSCESNGMGGSCFESRGRNTNRVSWDADLML
jgi:hypothetical protein